MFSFIGHWFVLLIYQPFLNLVVFYYWLVDQVSGEPNMGVAVILLTITIRLLLLPQSLNGIKNERKQIDLLNEIKELERVHADNPVELARRKKEILRSNPKMVIGEIVNVVIQVLIAIMLWRMFSTGLTGQDTDLIYSFMPDVALPFDLSFRGMMLDEKSFGLALLVALSLFIMESLSVLAAIPGSLSRSRAVKAQIVLPLISLCFFMFMPAGKQLFVLTTILFSIVLTIIRLVLVRFDLHKLKQEKKEEVVPDPILVETKE